MIKKVFLLLLAAVLVLSANARVAEWKDEEIVDYEDAEDLWEDRELESGSMEDDYFPMMMMSGVRYYVSSYMCCYLSFLVL